MESEEEKKMCVYVEYNCGMYVSILLSARESKAASKQYHVNKGPGLRGAGTCNKTSIDHIHIYISTSKRIKKNKRDRSRELKFWYIYIYCVRW